MKKLISLFIMMSVLSCIFGAASITVSAAGTEDLSRYLDSLFFDRNEEYQFSESDKLEDYYGCYIAKAATYAEIEQCSWASKYNESFFENNFLLAV